MGHIQLQFKQKWWPSADWICVIPHMRVYPKVSRPAAWSDNCKWYSFLPLGWKCIAILWFLPP